ncbi:hypothetical protein E1A91_A05G334800v1 [Gossypium mustelinum]|uniref:Uncharacterized protein n=1 Tax=Gossypium mustelinum TaxID=34275 RepID=A0A5D2ZGP0_GOSMU|nr:hypothetical protein E1A91_A05G334800v1 [Gossypium mustelinum]
MSSFCNGILRMPFFFLIPRMLTSYDSFGIPEYCEKYVKPKNVVGAEEVKSSDEKLSEDEYAASDDEEIAGK